MNLRRLSAGLQIGKIYSRQCKSYVISVLNSILQVTDRYGRERRSLGKRRGAGRTLCGRADRGECDIRFPYQVPENRYFVLGDHRATSIDSRSSVIGCVEKSQIVGTGFPADMALVQLLVDPLTPGGGISL